MLKNIDRKKDQADVITAQPLSRSARWALASLALSMLMPSLDTSIANAGLPALALGFNASFQETQWIVLAYLLAITALIVTVGRLGDIVGRRRLLLSGIGVFTAASLLCGLAPTLWLLVAARAAQGLGAAVMMALTVALAGEAVPKGRTGSAMGLLGTMSAIGTTLGPSIGGVLIAGFGWSSIFLVNVPIGILNFMLAYKYLAVDEKRSASERSGFDLAGVLLLGSSLAAYALAMTAGGGGSGPISGALLLAAFAGAGLFIFNELRTASPLVRMAMFRDLGLSTGLAMSSMVSTVMMATLVVGPFYLSKGLGLEPAFVGLALSAGPLVAALTGVPAGRIVDRVGAGRMTIIGLIGIAFGAVVVAIAPPRFGIAGYIAPIIVMTASYALFQAANNTAIMAGASEKQRGVISGMLSLSRNLGLITGASLMGAIFSAASSAAEINTASPTAVAGGMRITFAVAAVLIGLAIAAAIVGRYLATKDQGSAAEAECHAVIGLNAAVQESS